MSVETMNEKDKGVHTEDGSSDQNADSTNQDTTGSDEGKGDEGDQRFKDQQKRAEKAEADVKELKAKIAELEGNAGDDGENTPADSKKIKELEDKIEKIQSDNKAEKLNQAFTTAFEKASEDYEGIKVNEDAVRTLYFAKKKENKDTTVADVFELLYGENTGRGSSEDRQQGGDQGGESFDFDEVAKDPTKLAKVLKDPKAKSAYYAWRDKKGI